MSYRKHRSAVVAGTQGRIAIDARGNCWAPFSALLVDVARISPPDSVRRCLAEGAQARDDTSS